MTANMNLYETELDRSHYLKSDSLFFIQRGGNSGHILNWDPLKNHFESPVFFSSNDLYDFFCKLNQKIADYIKQKSEYENEQDPQLLTLTSAHVFNLQPKRFQKYWNNPNLFKEKLVKVEAKNLLKN